MPVYESGNNSTSIAAVAIVVLVLLALAGGWVLLANGGNLGGRDINVELPGRR